MAESFHNYRIKSKKLIYQEKLADLLKDHKSPRSNYYNNGYNPSNDWQPISKKVQLQDSLKMNENSPTGRSDECDLLPICKKARLHESSKKYGNGLRKGKLTFKCSQTKMKPLNSLSKLVPDCHDSITSNLLVNLENEDDTLSPSRSETNRSVNLDVSKSHRENHQVKHCPQAHIPQLNKHLDVMAAQINTRLSEHYSHTNDTITTSDEDENNDGYISSDDSENKVESSQNIDFNVLDDNSNSMHEDGSDFVSEIISEKVDQRNYSDYSVVPIYFPVNGESSAKPIDNEGNIDDNISLEDDDDIVSVESVESAIENKSMEDDEIAIASNLSVDTVVTFHDNIFTEDEEDSIASNLSMEDDEGTADNIKFEEGNELTIQNGNHEDTMSTNISLKNYVGTEEEPETIPIKQKDIETVMYYPIENGTIVLMNGNSKLYFHGLMTVKVLHGAVEVLGHLLNDTSDEVEVFSPRGSSFLYIQPQLLLCQDATKKVETKLLNLQVDNNMVIEIINKLNPDDVIFHCRTLKKNSINFIEKHIAQQLFPKEIAGVPRCTFRNNKEDWNVLKVNPQWDDIIKTFSVTSKMFLSGGKGVGKSTFLRYLVNKSLTTHPNILVIDLDPGQPEFTVPGCISATIVKSPLLGPNYTHLQEPERCIFVPNIKVSLEPDVYLRCVQELLKDCASLPQLPTIINFMGYTRMWGLDITCATIAYVNPTEVIQIQSRSVARNFESVLSTELVQSNSNFFRQRQYNHYFNTILLNSVANNAGSWEVEPRQVREMCILAYFSKMLPSNVLSIMDLRVRTVAGDLQAISIWKDNNEVEDLAVNATLVALCNVVVNDSVKIYKCYGWGIVRAIEPETSKIFILTPLVIDLLELIDCLVLGSVYLPPSIGLTSGNVGLKPFESSGHVTSPLGQTPKRTFMPAIGQRSQ